jgi:hypothetical protein
MEPRHGNISTSNQGSRNFDHRIDGPIMTIRTAVNNALLALGWIVTLVGCLMTAGALAGLYLLLVVGASAGAPLFLDVVVPPLQGAALHLAAGMLLAIAPFTLRWAHRRWHFNPSSSAGDL